MNSRLLLLARRAGLALLCASATVAGAAAVADAAFPGRNGRIAYEGMLGEEHAEFYL